MKLTAHTKKQSLSLNILTCMALLLAAEATYADTWQQDNRLAEAIEGIDSLNNTNSITPLISFSISASSNAWNRDRLDVQASYKSLKFDFVQSDFTYSQKSSTFTIDSPVKALDFSDAIRSASQKSPQQRLGDMIIDGAIGFNLHHW